MREGEKKPIKKKKIGLWDTRKVNKKGKKEKWTEGQGIEVD